MSYQKSIWLRIEKDDMDLSVLSLRGQNYIFRLLEKVRVPHWRDRERRGGIYKSSFKMISLPIF